MGKIHFRAANISDAEIYYKWINDKIVRKQSFNSDIIKWDEHFDWFKDKVSDPRYYFYIFHNEKNNIGQVRIQKIDNKNSIIGVSIDENFRGYGYGAKILEIACNDHLRKIPDIIINAYIKQENPNFDWAVPRQLSYQCICTYCSRRCGLCGSRQSLANRRI